jgi:hypothetical protein
MQLKVRGNFAMAYSSLGQLRAHVLVLVLGLS